MSRKTKQEYLQEAAGYDRLTTMRGWLSYAASVRSAFCLTQSRPKHPEVSLNRNFTPDRMRL